MSGRAVSAAVGGIDLQQRLWGAVALVGLVALIPFIGPLPVLALFPVAIAMVVLIRFPVVAVLAPLFVAPIAFTYIPGAGGLRVIHAAVMIAAGGVLLGVITGRLRTRPPAVLIFAALVAASFLVTTMTSQDTVESLTVSIHHILGLALAVAASLVVRQARENLLWILRGWVAVSLVVILPGIPGALTAEDRFAGALIEGRAQGVFAQPNDYGEFSLYAIMMSWALFVASRSRWDRTLAVVGGIAAGAGVAVSFSRGTWVGLLGVMVVACILAPRLLVPVLLTCAAFVPIFAISIATGTPPFAALFGRVSALFSGQPNPEDDRGLILAQALRLFRENLVFGRGPGTYRTGAYEPGSELIRRPYIHGHSILHTTAAEMGLVGVASVLALTAAFAFVVLRTRRQLVAAGRIADYQLIAVLAGGLVGIAAHGVLDYVYTNPFLIPLAWCQFGIVAGACAGSTGDWGRRRGLVTDDADGGSGQAEAAARSMPVAGLSSPP